MACRKGSAMVATRCLQIGKGVERPSGQNRIKHELVSSLDWERLAIELNRRWDGEGPDAVETSLVLVRPEKKG